MTWNQAVTGALTFLVSALVAGIVFGADPTGIRYVMMDTTHPSYNGIIIAARAVHEARLPGNTMSVRLSNDGTVAFVKMIEINAGFETAHFGKPAVISVAVDNAAFMVLLRTDPNWLEEDIQ